MLERGSSEKKIDKFDEMTLEMVQELKKEGLVTSVNANQSFNKMWREVKSIIS